MLPQRPAFGTPAGTPPPPVALTIAGFDPGSGAGVTADLQTFAAHGLFGTACITALTVQSTLGVRRVQAVAADLIAETLAELERDLPAATVKIGMLGSAEAVHAVAEWLRGRVGGPIPIVLDPVFAASSGAALLSTDGLRALEVELLPLVDWITPNRSEAKALGGIERIWDRWPALTVVVTGGEEDAPDQLYVPGQLAVAVPGVRIETTSTHGTGCAYSAALAAALLTGVTPLAAATAAKRFVEGALRAAPGLGGGRGPMDLLWPLRAPR